MTWRRLWWLVLLLGWLAAACSADGSDAADADPTPSAAVSSAPTSPEAAAPETTPPSAPPTGGPTTAPAEQTATDLRFTEGTTAQRPLPPGASIAGHVAFVGATDQDPRFVEVSLLRFEADDDATAAFTMVADSETAIDTDDTGLAIAFLADGASPGASPRDHHLLTPVGPTPTMVFARRLPSGDVLSGAASSVHPLDVSALLATVDDSLEFDPAAVPEGLDLAVDVPLPDGVAGVFRSAAGEVRLTIYEGADPRWFGFATHGSQSVPPEDLEAAGASALAYDPPASFGYSGQPIDGHVVNAVVGENLVELVYADGIAHAAAARVLAAASGDPIDALRDIAGTDIEIAAPTTTPADAAAPSDRADLEAPSDGRMAELQAFAEDARDRRAIGPIDFEFLQSFPADVPPGFFVTAEMWDLALALGLVDPDLHDPTSAGRARVERLRGIPGAVVLQPSLVFTEVVVVHEMIHVLDEGGQGASSSTEVVDPAQALAEGSAQRVAMAWVDELDPDVVARFGPFPWIFPAEGDERLSRAMQDMVEFAYDEGAWFVTALHDAGGNDAVDDAFADPPSTTEHILFPEAYLEREDPLLVAAPVPPEAATTVRTGTIGSFVLSLAVRAGDATTDAELALVRPWAGDAYVVYDSADGRCLAATIEMDTDAAANALGQALDTAPRTVAVSGSTIELATCVERG